MTQAFQPQGTKLKRGDDASPQGFTAIAELKTIGFGGSATDVLDATNMDSPSAFREKIAGLINPGQFNCDGNLIPSDVSQQDLVADRNERTVRPWKVVLPLDENGDPRGGWEFDAFVQSYDPDLAFDKLATFTAKLEITGPVTFDDSLQP